MNNNDKIINRTLKERSIYLINPYKPGAGTIPEYLAGRDEILQEANNVLTELKNGGMATHTIYYGVRGVGKTVILSKIEDMALNMGYIYAHIECDEHSDFIKIIASNCRQFINQMSLIENIKDKLDKLKAIFLSFKTRYAPEDNSFTFELNDTILNKYGNTDTGDLTTDLITLFSELGSIAKNLNKHICFFIDEIQSISKLHLTSLITTIHRMNQLELPILLIGAGLPTILRASGEAKSYSERLFNFIPITSLKEEYAIKALIEPAKKYNVNYTEEAIEYVLLNTGCYPFFIQQYGKLIWKYSYNSFELTKYNAEVVYQEYIEKLDNSFFGVRYNRSTKCEKKFLFAMAKCNIFPCSISDISKIMNKKQNEISLNRNKLINKGLIYSPSYGEVDFTVPQFDLYLKRKNESLEVI